MQKFPILTFFMIEKRFLQVNIENPATCLDTIVLENNDSSGITIMPYHELDGGTHKMVSCSGMYKRIPLGAEELVESTSGNTGYASAFYAQQIGMPIRIYLPEGMAPKKLQMLKDLNAEVFETPRPQYTAGARNMAQQYYDGDPETRWFFNQSQNPGNWIAHKEIADKLSEVDQLALIGGTCGAITGLSRGIREIRDVLVTVIDLDVAPHFLNKKYRRQNKWSDHGVVGAAPSKMSAIGEQFFPEANRTAIVSAEDSEKIFEESLKFRLNAGKSSIVNLVVAQKIAEYFDCMVGTATFDDVLRYKEVENVSLEDFYFHKENIAKFLRSELVKKFPIFIEGLHNDEKYSF